MTDEQWQKREQSLVDEIARLRDLLRTSNEWKNSYLRSLDELRHKLRELAG